MPFKRAFALPNIPLSLKLALQNATPNLKLKTSLEVLNKNLLATRINERRALSLQEVELDGSFLILHIVMKTCTV